MDPLRGRRPRGDRVGGSWLGGGAETVGPVRHDPGVECGGTGSQGMSGSANGRELDGRHNFDFLFGRWRIRNRKLADVADPLCTRWVEFDATAEVQPILGGLGHIDRMWALAPPGGEPFEGFTLRQFDPEEQLWRIWWGSSKRPGHLDPPVVGSWAGGRGTFVCDDTIGGRPVVVRFVWSAESGAPRWEQAFSDDLGVTWRVNWTMELSRQP